jgi:hypothetical protein
MKHLIILILSNISSFFHGLLFFAEKHGKTFIPPEVFFSCFLENVVIQKCPLFRFNITFM